MSPTRNEARVATRTRVLGAADRLFRERGFAATTIRDIADASSVSVGTVMAAGDKSALLVQIFDAHIEEGHAARTAPDPQNVNSCVAQLMDLALPFVTLFTSRQDLSRIYASILVSGSHSSTLFTSLASLLVDEIRSIISRHGCATPDSAAATAQAIYFAYIGTLFSWSARETAGETATHDTKSNNTTVNETTANGAAALETELSESLRTTFVAICRCKE